MEEIFIWILVTLTLANNLTNHRCICEGKDLNILETVSQTSNWFSSLVFKQLLKKNETKTRVYSSFGVHNLLLINTPFSRNETRKQMERVLRLPANVNYRNILKNIFNVEKALNSFNHFTIWNQILVGSEKKIIPVETQNTWIKEEFKKVQEKVKAKINAKVTLFSAVHFKISSISGSIEVSSARRPFETPNNLNKYVNMLYIKGHFIFGTFGSLDAKYIELPVEHTEMQIVIIVPNKPNSLPNLLKNLSTFDYMSQKSSSTSEVELYLPRFKARSSLNFKPILRNLNLTEMFRHEPNFLYEENGRKFFINKVTQKSYVEMDERNFVVKKPAEENKNSVQTLIVSRPFYFFIRWQNLVVLQGQIWKQNTIKTKQ